MEKMNKKVDKQKYNKMINILKNDKNLVSLIKQLIKKYRKAAMYLKLSITCIIISIIMASFYDQKKIENNIFRINNLKETKVS